MCGEVRGIERFTPVIQGLSELHKTDPQLKVVYYKAYNLCLINETFIKFKVILYNIKVVY
jgi:hypothetical protein